MKRAPHISRQLGIGPIVLLRVIVGGAEILHPEFTRRQELAGRPVGKPTKLSWKTCGLKTKPL